MRVSSINVAQPTNVNHNLRRKQTVTQMGNLKHSDTVSFGSKASLWGLIGAGAGGALGTVLSGGLLAPLLLASVGTYAGSVYGSTKDEDENDKSDY